MAAVSEMTNLKPGDFPIGSVLSRAAARMLLKNQRDTRQKIQVTTNVRIVCDPDGNLPDATEPHATPWIGDSKTVTRLLYVPADMSTGDAEKAVDDRQGLYK
jgi:hypothetical protein